MARDITDAGPIRVPCSPMSQRAPVATSSLARFTAPSWSLLLTVAVCAPVVDRLAAQDEAKPAASIPAELKEVVAAYAAKVAASAVFVSGRTIESVLAEEMAPDAPLQAMVRPFLEYEVDRDQRTVTAKVLGTEVTAAYVEGLGCTLVRGDLTALRARALPPIARAMDPRPWPLGDGLANLPLPAGIDGKALDQAIADAFVDRDGRVKAHTRAIVIAHRGRLIAERYAPSYDAYSVLPGWSMSKSLVNALIGLRIGDGKLALDRELPVPEWSAPDDPRRQLRLMDLLRMESGLDWSEDYEAAGSLALRMLFLESDYAALAASQPLVRAPREEHRYSSGTTNLLCRILRTTFDDERSYLAYARDRLFLPLGMTSALLEPDPSGVFVGSSFGFATARDWARFGQFYLQDGVVDGKRLLPEGWVAMARTPSVVSPRGDYGAHLWLNAGSEKEPDKRPFNRLPRDLFYLSGYEGQYVVCFPSQDLVVVRLGCTKRGGFDLHGFLQHVLQACSPDSLDGARK